MVSIFDYCECCCLVPKKNTRHTPKVRQWFETGRTRLEKSGFMLGSQMYPKFRENLFPGHQNQGPGSPKSSLEPSKMPFLQTSNLRRLLEPFHRAPPNLKIHFLSQLGSILGAKRLQNQSQNPKKSMLKSNTFSASILEGFGRRFGLIFGRFFGPKMQAKCKNTNLTKTLKIVILPG